VVRPVWPACVAEGPPGFDVDPAFFQRITELAVQKFAGQSLILRLVQFLQKFRNKIRSSLEYSVGLPSNCDKQVPWGSNTYHCVMGPLPFHAKET
jgi:hypothetical protein